MELQLAPDENLVKNWVYAEVKEDKNKKTEHELTITDKRVVVSEKTGSSVSRSETMIDNVVGVSTQYVSAKEPNSKKKLGIILVAVGAALIILGIVLTFVEPEFPGSIFIVLGAAALLVGLYFIFRKKTQGKLSVVIQTNIPESTVNYGFYANTMSLTDKKKTKTITVIIDLAAAEEIVDSIGALLLVKNTKD